MTLVVYAAARWLSQQLNNPPWANPVAVAITALVLLLLATGTPYDRYFDGAQFVHFLLGPATVALAIPLYRTADMLRRMLRPIFGALMVGALAGVGAAIGMSLLFGLSPETLRSMVPKSVTTPIAMGIAEQLGGLPSLTAVLVILTGIVGNVFGPRMLDVLRIDDDAVRGFALGLAAHGIGTARALLLSETAGAFAGLAMGLNGAMTTIVAPFVLWVLGM